MCDDDVKSRLIAAKLQVDSVLSPTQLLRFGTNCDDEGEQLFLMQLDQTTLAAVESGFSLVLRGHENDRAVVCTEKETYDVKEAKTSNCIILMDHLQTQKDQMTSYSSADDKVEVVERNVVCLKSSYLELKLKVPDTSRLREMVSKWPYKGPEVDENEYEDARFYTLDDFLDLIPASKGEIVEGLQELEACCINEKWRILDFEYVMESMSIILQVISSESWSFADFDINELTEKVNDSGDLVPDNIIHHLMSVYGTIENSRCSLIMEKLSRFFAEMLLQGTESFDFNEFMEVWTETMPTDMEANEEYLAGLALIDKTSRPPTIRRFSVRELPFDVEKRFDALFATREKWTMTDISPYLKDLCLKGQKISSLLTRYARSSLTGGEKVYSSRKCFSQ